MTTPKDILDDDSPYDNPHDNQGDDPIKWIQATTSDDCHDE
jgi:hypothetical protein